jgi:hypothetical protein
MVPPQPCVMLSCMVSKVFCKAYPVWQKAHAQTENLTWRFPSQGVKNH